MEGGIAEAVKETRLSRDDLVRIVEESKEKFIREALERGKTVPTEIIDDPTVYGFLVNDRESNYPQNDEMLIAGVDIYVKFILDTSKKGEGQGIPSSVMKEAILYALNDKNKNRVPTVISLRLIENCSIFLEEALKYFLEKKGYDYKVNVGYNTI